MLYIGGLVVILTFAAIIKKFETRLCLLLGGFLMAILSGHLMAAVDGFVKTMTSSLVVTICSIMGFAYIMKMTHCDEHLVKLLTKALKKVPVLLIPGAVVITWLINIPLTSAAGCSAAVGAILIPALIKSGVYPAMAAAAVFAGTWGSVLSPGNTHNNFISKMAMDAKLPNSSVMEVISVHALASCAALVVVVICVTFVAKFLKEGSGYIDPSETAIEDEHFKVRHLMAIMPVLPLVMLVLGTKQIGVLPPVFQSIPFTMILGSALAAIVTKTNPQEIVKDFWRGAGDSYGSVMGLIICAATFTAGMTAIGLTGTLIELMKESQDVAKMAGAFGSFLIAVLAGSGDAATLAFNGAITPHAADFGLGMIQLGSISNVAGALGRSCSPVAAGCIVCAGIAQISPMEIAKRNFVTMFLACCIIIVLL